MSDIRHLRSFRAWGMAALLLAVGTWIGPALAAADIDPPDRVARISYLGGNVSFQPGGAEQWSQASLNRPLVGGDRVYTDRNSRVEFELGGATLRLDEESNFMLLNLDNRFTQVELTGGTLNLDVRLLRDGEGYEIDTPTLAFVVRQPGNYRIDIAPTGDSTMVTVFDGSGDVYGENNASYSVARGNSYRFYDSTLRDYEVLDIPRSDPFDRWCAERNDRYRNSVSRRYVADDMIGYADLDTYGSWSTVPQYGAVWYPTRVEIGWTPYRSGHWSWIDPWGWSWIDAAPWGFAPFHYGRWAYIGGRWGWCPGPRARVSIYAPAMVAFIGGGWGGGVSIGIGGGPIGWFPLGPRDVYVPWYHASRHYFTNINVHNTTIINNTYITNVYNDYSRGRYDGIRHTYRNNVNAVTAVPRDVFTASRPVLQSRVRVDANALRSTRVVGQLDVAPVRASFSRIDPDATRATPSRSMMDRGVIARTAPPAAPAPIASRIGAIERNNARPLQQQQLRELSTPRARPGAEAAPSRVQVVGRDAPTKPAPLPMRAPADRTSPERAPTMRGRAGPATPVERTPAPGRSGPQVPERNAPTPRRGSPDEDRGVPGRAQPLTPGALPSSRFAPSRNTPSTNPRATGDERLNPPAQRAIPRVEREAPAPVERGTPRSAPQAAPQRYEPPAQRYEPRSAPQAAPQRYEPRSAPQTAPQRYEPRSAPQAAPQRYEPRSAPQAAPQRYEPPAQRFEPRSAPQAAPQRSEPRAAPRAAPQQERSESAPAPAEPRRRREP